MWTIVSGGFHFGSFKDFADVFNEYRRDKKGYEGLAGEGVVIARYIGKVSLVEVEEKVSQTFNYFKVTYETDLGEKMTIYTGEVDYEKDEFIDEFEFILTGNLLEDELR